MLLRAYGWQFLALALAAGCIGLGVVTFDTPSSFSAISAFAFVFCAVVFRSNVNILAICLILSVEKLVILVAFDYFGEGPFWRILAYGFVGFSIYWLWEDKLAKLLLATLLLSLATEVYWYVSGYEPRMIYYYLLKASIYLIVRDLLVYQSHELALRGWGESDSLRLDWFIYKARGIVLVVECVMVFEYLIRHTTSCDAVLVYHSYSYIMQIMNVWVFWLVLREANKLLRERFLVA